MNVLLCCHVWCKVSDAARFGLHGRCGASCGGRKKQTAHTRGCENNRRHTLQCSRPVQLPSWLLYSGAFHKSFPPTLPKYSQAKIHWLRRCQVCSVWALSLNQDQISGALLEKCLTPWMQIWNFHWSKRKKILPCFGNIPIVHPSTFTFPLPILLEVLRPW